MEYVWEVTGLKTTNGGGVVQTYWRKIGTDADGNVGTFSGATPFDVDESAPDYIPFDQLTEADVLGWIQGVVTGSYEDHVNHQIQRQIDQQTITDAAMPWAPVEDHPPAPIEAPAP